MSKYYPLERHLASQHGKVVTLAFDQIERIIGSSLPKSAFLYAAFWANILTGTSMLRLG